MIILVGKDKKSTCRTLWRVGVLATRGYPGGLKRHCELEFRSMIDEPQAREVAKGAFESEGVVLGGARELSEGWFFPLRDQRSPNLRWRHRE